MSRQAQAERERRATITLAEAEFQAAQKMVDVETFSPDKFCSTYLMVSHRVSRRSYLFQSKNFSLDCSVNAHVFFDIGLFVFNHV